MRKVSIRPSAGVVIGTLALVVALGGTGYAATKISGSNIKAHSISGIRLKNNTLTGKQIRESTLGTVPNAKHAGTATTATKATTATTATTATAASTAVNALKVDGEVVSTFNFTETDNQASTKITIPGGSVSGSCPSSAPSLVVAGSGASGESLTNSGVDVESGSTPFAHNDSSLTTSDLDNLAPVPGSTGAGTAVITRPSSGVTTISYSYQQASGSCIYTGTVIATP